VGAENLANGIGGCVALCGQSLVSRPDGLAIRRHEKLNHRILRLALQQECRTSGLTLIQKAGAFCPGYPRRSASDIEGNMNRITPDTINIKRSRVKNTFEYTMKFSKINGGKYTVELNLNEHLHPDQIKLFKDQLEEIKQCDNDFTDICKLKGDTLKYDSETVLPLVDDNSKEKVLLVFGNPAIHSVKHGMFYFSRADLKRHSMWGKLSKACLMQEFKSKKPDSFKARREESIKHKDMILAGTSSDKYLIGFTTFYSFPTPVEKGFKFSNVAGVEKIFAPMIDTIVSKEIKRIKSYEFFKNAQLVFVQKSSCKAYREASNHDPLFWPIRGKGASGNALVDLLQSHQNTGTPSLLKTFRLSIGGYFGPSYSLELKGQDIFYETFGNEYELKNSEIISPTLGELDQFLGKIIKIGIWEWKKLYINPHILDGTSWSVSIEYEGKRFKSSGSNAYPERFNEFTKIVRQLINNKPFQ
jgi:hypothetical protein